MNAVTSVQLESQIGEAYTSTTPSSRPPTSAPRRLPMPPRTAAVNALMPMMKPMSNFVMSNWMVNSRAATPAIAPPSTKTSMITRSWLTPIREAVSGSCATARTPRPRRLLFTNVSSATIITMAPMMISSRVLVTGRSRPGIVKTTLRLDHGRHVDRHATEGRAEERLQHLAEGLDQHERAADGGDQEDQRRSTLPAQRPVGDPFDGQCGACRGQHRREQCQHGGADDRADPHAGRGAEDRVDAEHRPGAHHEHLGVGEVDQLHHAVHHGVAERDERVDGSAGDAVQRVTVQTR